MRGIKLLAFWVAAVALSLSIWYAIYLMGYFLETLTMAVLCLSLFVFGDVVRDMDNKMVVKRNKLKNWRNQERKRDMN